MENVCVYKTPFKSENRFYIYDSRMRVYLSFVNLSVILDVLIAFQNQGCWLSSYFSLFFFLIQLNKKPLTAVEFVAPLAKIEPIYKEEEEAFKVVCHFFCFKDHSYINWCLDVVVWLVDYFVCATNIYLFKVSYTNTRDVVDRFKVNDKDMTLFWCIYC